MATPGFPMKKYYKKFVQWMGYNPPYALSSHAWNLFEREFKAKAPIRFFIKRKLMARVSRLSYKYQSLVHWIDARLFYRYHIVKTGLNPGYASVDQIILHTNFNLLKDYVEVTVGRHNRFCSPDNNLTWTEKYVPFYRGRYVNEGIAYLEWETTLADPNLPTHERSDDQAAAAKEVLALYRWWVDERPARKPVEIPEYDKQGFGDDLFATFNPNFNHNAPDYIAYEQALDAAGEQERLWRKQDTDMLVRLMKIREKLWV